MNALMEKPRPVTVPLVSVAMITYNHEDYIRDAIESVLKQETDFPFELVVGEDCSTDDTRRILLEYQRQHPEQLRVVTSERNVGLVKNLYRTEKACEGKYIAYCEGDDYWQRTDKLQKQVDYLEAHPECVMLYGEYDRHYMATSRIIQSVNKHHDRPQPPNPDISTILFDPLCHIMTCAVCLRRDVLHRVIDADPELYQSGRFLMGDTCRWAEVSRFGVVTYLEESLATRRVLVESVSHSQDVKKVLRFTKSGLEMMLHLITKHGLSAAQQLEFRRRWCECSLRLAFYERDGALARQVREHMPRLTVTNRLRFWGAQNRWLNTLLVPGARLCSSFKRLLRPRTLL